MSKTLRLATRGSNLALAQAVWVSDLLQNAVSGLKVETMIVKTTGDLNLDDPLHKAGGKGLFTAEIDQALLGGSADFAVHSLKDLPTVVTEGLVLAAVPQREAVYDVLAGSDLANWRELPEGAKIGTGSLRRGAQLLAARADLELMPVRGNVQTRLEKAKLEGWDGTVLAAAGLSRLGLGETPCFSLAEIMLPAAGQGAIGIVCCENDSATRKMLSVINDLNVRKSVTAERSFLAATGAGCHAPVGVRAELDLSQDVLNLAGAVFSLDGRQTVQREVSGPAAQAEELGEELAKQVIAFGGAELLRAAGFSEEQ